MCGIAGFVDYRSQSDQSVLQAMTDALLHRGPDASGYHINKNDRYSLGLGHRRLSIIDLSPAGNQPMSYANERFWIVFNGEIYNFSEIRKKLTDLGHSFISSSDTEVILHAYHEWGPACLQEFIGMFALVIYDTKEHKLFACRDRAGVKPFFYSWHDGLFLFGSELKALMQHPRFEKKLLPSAVSAFLQYGYIPSPETIFAHTFKLPPAHYLEVNLQNPDWSPVRYWDVYDHYNQPRLKIDMEEAIAETESILTRAFHYRMVADVPVGVFLSGGYDSACLTALLQTNSGQRIKTFTIGVPDPQLDEAPYARSIARHLGTDHQELYCTESEALALVPQLPDFYDEPFGDISAIPTMLVSKMARSQVTVALSADAGDEIFGGYDRYEWMLKYHQRMNRVPAAIRKSSLKLLNLVPFGSFPKFRNNHLFQQKLEKLQIMLRDPSPPQLYQAMTYNYTERERKKLLLDPMPLSVSAHDRNGLNAANFDPLTYTMARDYETYMVDDILQKVDRATMSVSLEGREPFLDQNVIEWAARLPASFKIHKGVRKYILRSIVHKHIPAKMMERPKMGFMIPVHNWMFGALKDLTFDLLSEDKIREQGLFDPAGVKEIMDGFFVYRKEHISRIWYLLMFQLWYQRWMK